MALRLVVEIGDRTVRHPLGEGNHLVGSSPECSVRLRHPAVSRQHARISVTGDLVEIEDLGSTNGTHIAGRQIQGTRKLEPGQELAFGSVPARLEEVPAQDLEPAVTFGDGTASRVTEPESGPSASTAASGSLQTFALHRLPELMELVAERAGAERMAQAVGAALFDALPCGFVEVDRPVPGSAGDSADPSERTGVLFTARSEHLSREAGEATDSSPREIHAEGRRARVRVGFAHSLHARVYAPLVETAARLIDLAEGGASRTRSRKPEPPPLPDPPTVVSTVRRLYAAAGRIARGGVSVLIRGASGTGKEVLARWIHSASPRADQPFVALNCAALPGDLLEAELFGVERGAATGVEARPGKFELADSGTLFLDEIGDMAPATQAKILRVLQEREVFRLGATEPRPARVRVLAASNRDLDALLEEGAFRTDLYHRIADWTVTLPSLTERRADIPNLGAHFLARETRERGISVAGISRGALETLEAHDWPGNVRQLEREMSRAALFLENGDLLESSHLSEAVRRGAPKAPQSLKERLQEVERREIRQALDRHDGDVTAAAEELGLGRSTLYRRIKDLGVASRGLRAGSL